MIDLTLEQLESWELNPITQKILNILNEEIKEEIEKPLYSPGSTISADGVALKAAYNEGLKVAGDGILSICDSLKMATTDEEGNKDAK